MTAQELRKWMDATYPITTLVSKGKLREQGRLHPEVALHFLRGVLRTKEALEAETTEVLSLEATG